jgi:hypothetical protein
MSMIPAPTSFRRTVLALFLSASAGSAMALDWNFSYDFPNAPGERSFASGVLTTTDTPLGNAYTITAISGTRTFNGITNTITGLLVPDSFGGNDNLLRVEAPWLTGLGVSFTLDGDNNGRGGNQVNVFFDRSPFAQRHTEFNGAVGWGSFAVTPVPEPSAALLAAVGLLALIGVSRLRAKRPSVLRYSFSTPSSD